MSRLDRYRRFVTIPPRNIFERPKFMEMSSDWSDWSAWTPLVSVDVRQGGSLSEKPKERLRNGGAYSPRTWIALGA